MGLFLMGSYIVTMPLLIRQNHEGTSSELAWMNIANAAGLFLSSMTLLKMGGVKRPGRALLLSLAAAGFAARLCCLCEKFRRTHLRCVPLGGLGGGLVMIMSRSIMQEQAPAEQRGRIMAFFSLSFMGAGLVGSLLNGYLVEIFRAEGALLFAASGIILAVVLIRVTSSIWHLESHWS
jgi:Major Facilitator Superfamily.